MENINVYCSSAYNNLEPAAWAGTLQGIALSEMVETILTIVNKIVCLKKQERSRGGKMIPLCIIEAFHFNGIKLKGNKTILLRLYFCHICCFLEK